jgi:hypothetical protein
VIYNIVSAIFSYRSVVIGGVRGRRGQSPGVEITTILSPDLGGAPS